MQSKKKCLPPNLLRQQQRERRHTGIVKYIKRRNRRTKKKNCDFECCEQEALLQATEQDLRKILKETELLSDIPHDCAPHELLGEIAIAKGHSTTIYVLRDGLSTLTIVLPQRSPTIANLKRAIEATSRVQLHRELRERYENRLKRRCAETTATATAPTLTSSKLAEARKERTQSHEVESLSSILKPFRSTGEFVCSTTHCGQPHRPNVSWRFLWRAYALFNVDTKEPINDADGRKLLSECDIENASTIKFCHREKYFKRRRQ